jgi:histidyl-tRNA synthetase
LLIPLFARGKLTASRSVPTVVLIALRDDAARPACDELAAKLRARGISAEVAPTAARYGKQIRYADQRGIPFVWFPASGDTRHEVKDIRSGEQTPADPATWRPPAEDWHPEIVVAEQGEQS